LVPCGNIHNLVKIEIEIGLVGDKQEKLIYSWDVHLANESRLKTLLILLFILSIALIILVSYQSVAFSLLSVILLIGALSRYFIPIHYDIDDQRVRVKTPLACYERRWSEFRCFYQCRRGIQLSTFEIPHRLDSFRGLYLILPEGPVSEVLLESLKKHLKECY